MRRTPLVRKTPLKSASRLPRSAPLPKKNQRRLDKRTKAYRAYMASPAWQGRRVAALQAAEYRCQRCGFAAIHEGTTVSVPALLNGMGLHVHHQTYARFGHELPEDLEVVCEPCHRKEHAGRFIRPRGLRGGRA